MTRHSILSFERVSKNFPGPSGAPALHAVRAVSMTVERGKTLAIVGESGSGKSTLARMLMRLEATSSGRILLDQEGSLRDISSISPQDFCRRVQMVFQDPYASLNGRKRIWEIVSDGATNLGLARTPGERRDTAQQVLEAVGMSGSFLDAYPDRLSGGQRQRVSIARALASQPEILVLDEPLSALDVSVQAQIINLLLDLQARLGLTYLFISHDLAVVRHVADRVAVMCSGQLLEYGPVEEVIDNPRHPYSLELARASFAIRTHVPYKPGPVVDAVCPQTFPAGASA
ncbi:ATP-binding cassette domain-containing protein [Enterobacterales bacterium AE_CKDN230030158-1A_HGKHYDSX7]